MPGIGPHPKGLHKWWAPLPLPSARAVLFASLVDDPTCDPKFAHASEEEQGRERERLFSILRALLRKKPQDNGDAFVAARAAIRQSCGESVPTVFDPFAGSSAIPIEAQRLGLGAVAGDLNPIAVLIGRISLEVLPRFQTAEPINPEDQSGVGGATSFTRGGGLARDVRFYAQRVLAQVRPRLGRLYPSVVVPGGTPVPAMAWVWARTVTCQNPGCRAALPMVSNFELSRKDDGTWIEPSVNSKSKQVAFRIRTGPGTVPPPTKVGQGATFRCLICSQITTEEHVKAAGVAGRLGVQLLATVADSGRKRLYFPASDDQTLAAESAVPGWVPDQTLPHDPRNIWCTLYGLTRYEHLFSRRQLRALSEFADEILAIRRQIEIDAVRAGHIDDHIPLASGGSGARAYAEAVTTLLAFGLDRCADFNNSLCRWVPTNEKVMNLFSRQAIPMVWDFAEANILHEGVGGWTTCVEYVADCAQATLVGGEPVGHAIQHDAANADPPAGPLLVSTDPPYYDNIAYADLSDFFYVWLRRVLADIHPDLLGTMLSPKSQELVATPYRFDGDKTRARDHFEGGFRNAFTRLQGRLDPRFPMTVYYAYKQSEDGTGGSNSGKHDLTTGWETMLQALISSGFQITGTWPVRASQAWRMTSIGTNALASYIVLSCRPIAATADVASRRDFIASLRNELPTALLALQQGGIAPVDLAQAAIGPGMAVFSRYARVIEADGASMTVRTALGLINESLDATLSEQEGDFDAETRWAIAWFEQNAMNAGPYGVAETLSKAKNTAVNALVSQGIVDSKASKVRLFRRDELDGHWDPAKDGRLTVWEITQHLMCVLEIGGEASAADLLRRVGGLGEPARELAYRLYSICEKKRWPQEALAYNALVVAWPAIVRTAAEQAGQAVQLSLEG
jgi:putative DNA methylase